MVIAMLSAFPTNAPKTARASGPPPLIEGVVQPRLAMPSGDGPMCQAPDPTAAEAILPDRMGVLLEAPATEHERRFVDRALTACESLRGPVRLVADPFQVLALVRLEHDLGIPESARGILVGAWCVETSMKARPSQGKHFLGDWHEGVALASGSFQLHETGWGKTCRGTEAAPHDLLWAASCWWYQVLKAEKKARRVSGCSDKAMLRVAEAAASNVRRYGFDCRSKSGHWQVMEQMRAIRASQ
jgi:hypothetical protein